MVVTPNRQSARSQTTRDQIAQAALTVFALKGYSAASMDDVCMAAGVSKGGLYHHFPTKVAVLRGVTDRLASIDALVPPFESASSITSLSHEALGRVLIDIWAEASRDERLREQLLAGYEAKLDAGLQARLSQPLGEILRIGTLIQMLTQTTPPDTAAAARRLGIDRAA